MSRLLLFLESYTAGGSDQVAHSLISNLKADLIFLLINRSIDPRILFSTPLPAHVQVHRYRLITPMDIGIFANHFKKYSVLFWPIKLVDYLVRYPLLLCSFVYFVFFLRRFHATHFIAHNGGYPGGLYCGTATMASALLPDISSFFAFHSLPRAFSRTQWPIEWLWDRILDLSCKMICVSHKSGNLLRSMRAFKQQPTCIHNGLPSVKLKRHQSADELKLLHVGYFDFNKNQRMVVKCLAQLINQGFDSIRLTFVGDCLVLEAREEVDALVKQLGLQNYVAFTGFQDNLSSFYDSHDLLVCTSKIESFPMVILEAMRVGMPVLSTNVGGIAEQVQDGVTGYLVDVDDIAGMRDKISFFYQNRDQIRSMGESGHRAFQERFTIKHMMDQYNTLLGLNVETL